MFITQQQFEKLKHENAKIKHENAKIKHKNAKIKHENTELKRENTEIKLKIKILQKKLDLVLKELPPKKKKTPSSLKPKSERFRPVKKKKKQAKKVKSDSLPKAKNTPFCLNHNIKIDEIRILDVTEEQVLQSNCSCTFDDYYTVNKQDETTHRVWVPGHFKVVKCKHKKKKCKCGQSYLRAITPADLKMNSSSFNPAFHAQVSIDRILNAMPLYRQKEHLKRLGYSISKQTLGKLLHRSAYIIAPIANKIREQVSKAAVLATDGSHISIFNPEQCKKKSIWVHVDEENNLCGFLGFEFTTAEDLAILSDPNGKFIINDAQANILKMSHLPGYKRLIALCLAHLRRKIYDLLDYHHQFATNLLTKIRKLYEVECLAKNKNLSLEKHLELRQNISKNIMESIYKTLSETYANAAPQSKLYKMIQYALGTFKKFKVLDEKGEKPERWLFFCTFLQDARIPIDNNISERLLRIIAKWRDSSLWIGSLQSLPVYCDLLTVLKTCELRSVNPLLWLQNVFIKLNSFRGPPPDDIILDLIPGN